MVNRHGVYVAAEPLYLCIGSYLLHLLLLTCLEICFIYVNKLLNLNVKQILWAIPRTWMNDTDFSLLWHKYIVVLRVKSEQWNDPNSLWLRANLPNGQELKSENGKSENKYEYLSKLLIKTLMYVSIPKQRRQFLKVKSCNENDGILLKCPQICYESLVRSDLNKNAPFHPQNCFSQHF